MENLSDIKNKIEEGAKFNGVIYGKDNGKNWTTIFIYLDGEFCKICQVPKKESTKVKQEILSQIF